MTNQEAYNLWSSQYDNNINRTRDLEAKALRSTLSRINFSTVLEIGCGTGKNSIWLAEKAKTLVAVDFSEEMLSRAKNKLKLPNIQWEHANITHEWNFTQDKFDLVSFSLVLEHIEDIDFVFCQAGKKLKSGGYLYLGELHPFKQYTGSLARFDTGNERIELKCFKHSVSEFFRTATRNGFSLIELEEWFDEDGKHPFPRILTMVFMKN